MLIHRHVVFFDKRKFYDHTRHETDFPHGCLVKILRPLIKIMIQLLFSYMRQKLLKINLLLHTFFYDFK